MYLRYVTCIALATPYGPHGGIDCQHTVQCGGVRIHTSMTERRVEEQVTFRNGTMQVERRVVNR